MKQNIEQIEKDLTIKLLETKIQRITGKKVIYENDSEFVGEAKETPLDASHYTKSIMSNFNHDDKESILVKLEELLDELDVRSLKAMHELLSNTEDIKESKEVITEDFGSLMQIAQDIFTDPTRIEIAGESLTKGAAALALLAGGIGLPLAAGVAAWAQTYIQEKGSKEKALQALKAQPSNVAKK